MRACTGAAPLAALDERQNGARWAGRMAHARFDGTKAVLAREVGERARQFRAIYLFSLSESTICRHLEMFASMAGANRKMAAAAHFRRTGGANADIMSGSRTVAVHTLQAATQCASPPKGCC
ncbi:hypothetical protein PT2222_240038 [Paraburkholderia tropica]